MSGRRLLVVSHSRGGGTARLTAALLEGTRYEGIEGIAIDHRDVTAADAAAVRGADGIAIVTPERFGSMAGLTKDLFERIWPELVDEPTGLPYVLVVKGAHDGTGTVESVERIATGLRWRRVLDPIIVVGDPTDAQLAAIAELGATFAAGLADGVF